MPREAGFSLLEMLVASFISILIVGGMLLMLTHLQEVHRDTQQLIDARQSPRIALEQIQRDLQLAGVGISSMLSPLPPIVPRADVVVDIRYNRDGLNTVLVADMSEAGAALDVSDASGFEAGMMVAIFDSSGTLDMVTLTAVDTVTNRLEPRRRYQGLHGHPRHRGGPGDDGQLLRGRHQRRRDVGTR